VSIITIDFETYYDKDYSLSKMTTEEYINDPRFEVIGMGIKVDDGPAIWYTGEDVEWSLQDMGWSEHAILCHNTLFDGAILAWKYGVKPGMWLDTLCMARAIHGVDAGGSLKKLAERYEIGEKGDEVINALGKRRADFTTEELYRYGEYCKNDADLTYKLFDILSCTIAEDEMKLIDMTLRMYTEPTLMVDDAVLLDRLEAVRNEQSSWLRGLMTGIGANTEEEVRSKLSSNPKFAELLKRQGVTPPEKVSPTTGKTTFAFAKTDQGFIELQEHPDVFVQELCRVRLGTKSTIEESRIERFIDIGARNRGYLPVPLKYYGAHTGRWSGLDSVNFQNLPSRDKAKKSLKNSIVAPDGHYIINCDSSQIEARVLAWLAGQDEVVKAFAEKRDIYCEDATKAFGREITKADVMERFVGKTMRLGLGYGTGAIKLQRTLTLGGADLGEDKCVEMVNSWRESNDKIVALWRAADRVLDDLIDWPSDNEGGPTDFIHLGKHKCLTVDPTGIKLPNGLYIRYPGLRTKQEKDRLSKIYTSRKGDVNLWGGGVVENVVQALARIVVGEQMLKIQERYPIALTVHDAAVPVVKKAELAEALAFVTETMSTPPSWAPGLPVACEAKYGRSYGEC
jgi:DNA polymerase